MKTLLNLLRWFSVLILLLVLASYFFPRYVTVSRSLLIAASPEKIYTQVGDLQNWKNWGVWYQRDPGMTYSYSPTTTQVGDWVEWKESKGQRGKMTFASVEPPARLSYKLERIDWGMASTGNIKIFPEQGGFRVTWSDRSDLGLNPVQRWFGLFLDKMMGPDFEAGLANLKKLCEAANTPPAK